MPVGLTSDFFQCSPVLKRFADVLFTGRKLVILREKKKKKKRKEEKLCC